MKKQLIITSLLLPLFACGGGSSSPTTATAETGIFLDSPVINIGYRTETQNGVTNPLGEYKYLLGETVTFFIGNLDFPSTPATGVVTPLNLANTQDPRNDVVVNMIRLLQTLDKDGEPSNGIEITNSAKTVAIQVDFNLSPANFSTSSSVMTLITNADQDVVVTELVSINDAVAHFEITLAGITVLSNASLNGNYFLVGQSTDLLETNAESFMWKNAMTFDGSGGCSFIGSVEKGAILNSTTGIPEIFVGTPDNGSCTYSLANNGTLTIDGQSSYAVSSDTNTIIGVNTYSEVGLAGAYIESMVKQSNSLSSASLNGTYHVVGKSTDLLETNTESFMWKNAMTFDGSGGCSFIGSVEKGAILNSTTGIPEIFVGTPDNGSCTYSLANDGTLTIDGQPSYAVSSDTNTIIGVNTYSEVGLAGAYIESMVKISE